MSGLSGSEVLSPLDTGAEEAVLVSELEGVSLFSAEAEADVSVLGCVTLLSVEILADVLFVLF